MLVNSFFYANFIIQAYTFNSNLKDTFVYDSSLLSRW